MIYILNTKITLSDIIYLIMYHIIAISEIRDLFVIILIKFIYIKYYLQEIDPTTNNELNMNIICKTCIQTE